MNKTFKALAHPVRREILSMLRDGPMISGDIATRFDMAWPTMTGHLKVLKEAGLVHGERFGTQIRYRLNAGAAEEAIAALMALFGKGEEK
ncbi:MAG: metalloregulator ArsR/SmtB family transcription factor [Robiginitomaculum sp.]|nr:metalloregulator ArsR/SmtB family transcription factor [Robiginitomaculum sp.]MDQ7077169.1 metalloregulator ArsR/SmtB family transcription factor [Robiginitomaculum sp.]